MTLAARRRQVALGQVEKYHQPAIQTLNKFIRDLGRNDDAAGLEFFLSLLSLSAVADDRLNDLIAAFALPEAQSVTPGEVVASIGFRPGEILKITKDAVLTLAQAKSMNVLAEQLPAIMGDVVARAQVHYLPCQVCGATGKVTPRATKEDPNPAEEVCRTCAGYKQLRQEADFQRQELVFDMAKMLPKGSTGPSVAIQQNFGGGGGDSATVFSKLVKATDLILHGNAGVRVPAAPAPPASAASAALGEVVDADVVVASPQNVPREAPDAGSPPVQDSDV